MALSFAGITTRLLAIAAGIAAGLAWPDGNHRPANEAAPMGTKRDVHPHPPDTAALLDGLLAEVRAKREVEKNPDPGKDLFDLYDELYRTLEPAADPRAAFLELVAATEKAGGFDDGRLETEEGLRKLAMLGVRYAQWFDRDPHAPLAALDTESEVMVWVNDHFISRIATDRVNRQGLRASMAWLKESSAGLRGVGCHRLGSRQARERGGPQVAAGGPPGAVEEALEQLRPGASRRVVAT